MKICPACRQGFEADDFSCPVCGYSPILLDGYPAFAPELEVGYDGFEADFFATLADSEEGNFWFESRNSLLTWALGQYFPKADTLLEIGCGTGFVLSGIKREFQNIKLFGSDIFSKCFAYSKNRLPGTVFFQMDARNIPFKNEFDVIGAFDVLEHIEEDEIVLSQIFNALKSGGGVILTVPQHRWLWSKNDEIACHKRRYLKKELAEKVAMAGFQILHMTSFVSLLLPLMAASRLLGVSNHKDRKGELQQPHLLNELLKGICSIERRLIANGVSFPAGGSLLCVGQKRL